VSDDLAERIEALHRAMPAGGQPQVM